MNSFYIRNNDYNHTAYLHNEQTENTSMFVL